MAVNKSTVVRGELRFDEPMSKHTSWRVGGPAKQFFIPQDIQDLSVFMRTGDYQEPLIWLGLGSNLLVRDGGVPGTVISTQRGLTGMERINTDEIRVESGVTCAKLARFCVKQKLSGLEFLIGIPGSMGGALTMNAGAFGSETWDRVIKVEMMDGNGGIHFYKPEQFQIGYRNVEGPERQWFVAAHLRLQHSLADQDSQQIRLLLEQRGMKQPIGTANCGSVFRNPAGGHAARLIETALLKGVCVGGACVSEKHANFIINTGNASAKDIEDLIDLVQEKVEAVHGVRLQREVVIIGEYEKS